MVGCIKCSKIKGDRYGRYLKLIPIPTGERPFEEIAMDFIVELQESEDYNPILVVIDRFNNIQYNIPAKTTWTAEDIADSYINDM